MTSRHKTFLYSAAAVGLALGIASQASAFDRVHWTWDAKVWEKVWIDIDVNPPTFDPPVLVQVEQLQVSVGDIYASTDQSYTRIEVNVPETGGHGGHGGYGGYGGHGHGHGPTPPVFNLDALSQLASIQGAATAVANLATIDTEGGALFHDTQVAFGDFNTPYYTSPFLTLAVYDPYSSGNTGLDAVRSAALAAQFGLITQGDVTANASANWVKNASVQLDSLGAGNVHTVNVTPVDGSSIAIGDLNQFSYMNVSATASAKGLKISGYNNLGNLTTPVSNLTATAIGNLSTITNKVATTTP